VLELGNGTTIADIVGICRYFEELNPEPRLMGRTAEEKESALYDCRHYWDGHRRLLRLGKAQGAGAFNPPTSLAFGGFSAS
jgi:glutathione S-transferase